MASLADYRNTQFEIARFHQGPNGIGVEVTERGVYKSAPPRMELSDGSDGKPADLDAQLVADWISVLTRTEEAYAKRYAELVGETKATDPSHVHGLVATATKAKADAKAAQEAHESAEAKRAAAEAEHAALSLQIAQMKAQVSASQGDAT